MIIYSATSPNNLPYLPQRLILPHICEEQQKEKNILQKCLD